MLGFSAKFAFDLIEYAARHGANSHELYAELGEPRAALSREDLRIAAATMARVWQTAHHQTGEPYLALRMGQTEYSAQQSTNLIMKNALTVREAFDQAVFYGELIANVMAVSARSEEGVTSLTFDPRPLWREQDPGVTLDCLLIAMMSAAVSVPAMTGVVAYPERVDLDRTEVRDVDELSSVFGCPVCLNAGSNAIVFDDDVLARKVVQPNAALQAAIKAYADEICHSISLDNSVAEQVRRRIVRGLPHRVGLERMAEQMHMSVRTLQRRLRAEGYVYRQLADLVHTQTARHHLTQGTRPLEEVAYLSGYSDAASLTRAYKRRYGGLPKRPRSASG